MAYMSWHSFRNIKHEKQLRVASTEGDSIITFPFVHQYLCAILWDELVIKHSFNL